LLDDDSLVAGKESASSLFSRGRYTVGREIREESYDALRRAVE
jgi:hypothetical protein